MWWERYDKWRFLQRRRLMIVEGKALAQELFGDELFIVHEYIGLLLLAIYWVIVLASKLIEQHLDWRFQLFLSLILLVDYVHVVLHPPSVLVARLEELCLLMDCSLHFSPVGTLLSVWSSVSLIQLIVLIINSVLMSQILHHFICLSQ